VVLVGGYFRGRREGVDRLDKFLAFSLPSVGVTYISGEGRCRVLCRMGFDPGFCRSSLTLLMEYYVRLSIMYHSFWSFYAFNSTFSTLLML
jgi:hypothetical protein